MTETQSVQAPQILPLLDRQLHIAEVLEGLLMAEYSALLGSDVAALGELVAQKRSTAESLEHSSIALSEYTSGAPQIAVQQAGTAAIEKWQRLGAIADRLRRQNLANGALLNERQNRLRWVAERAGGGAQPLYAPRAHAAFASGLSGRSLART